VTLDGQSAGGASVVYHLLNKGSVGLFQRAVVQSNPQTIPWKEQADGEELGKLFGKHLGCGDSGRDLTCMRKATVAEVLTAQHDAQQHFSVFDPLIAFLPWTPMVGTGPTALPQQPLVMFAAGNVASKVPLMTVSR
jgi:carboxylesterase type B